jgi:glutamate formiminotransferase
MNLEDWRRTPPHAVVERIARDAARRGVEVAGSELVGLMPAGAAVAAAERSLLLSGFDVERVLELRLLGE